MLFPLLAFHILAAPAVSAVEQPKIIDVSASQSHVLALREDGSVVAWGWNFYGELGDGTRHFRPGAVQVLGLSNVSQVAAGSVVSLALTSEGTVKQWGFISHQPLPPHGTPIPVDVPNLNGVISIKTDGAFRLPSAPTAAYGRGTIHRSRLQWMDSPTS